MSNTIYKIFPRYYAPKYTDEQILGSVNMLIRYSKEIITFRNYNSVQFIDCGDGLEHIFCPWCGREFSREYWQQTMDNAYDGKSFFYLGFESPCCKMSSFLQELVYVKPCGFATFVIEVHNPSIIPCVVELHEMGMCFRNVNFFRMISAHI